MSLVRPGILWRFVASELTRLLVVTVLVVVAVMSFAAAVKPMADGLLSSVEALRFMMYATVPMLQYALPFAAGFAATLAYHRMGQDNELTACYAGGLSHRALLLPALAAGVILAGAMVLLEDQAMPRLLRQMRLLVTEDIASVMETAIERGESVRLDKKRWIYADTMQRLDPGPDSGADSHFMLTGVVAVELDDAERVSWEASARLAYIWLYRSPASISDDPNATPMADVVITLRDSIGVKQNKGTIEDTDTTLYYRLPGGVISDTRHMSWAELDRVLIRPELMNWFNAKRLELAGFMGERLTADAIRNGLSTSGRAELSGGGRTVSIRAASIDAQPGAKGFALHGPGGAPPEIIVTQPDGRSRTHRPARAFLALTQASDTVGESVTIHMEEVSTTGITGDSGAGVGGVINELDLPGLAARPDPLPELRAKDSWSLRRQAEERAARPGHPDPRLSDAVASIGRDYANISREVFSRKHDRIASALACIVIVLNGAVMAMRLTAALPLTVYLWSFLPGLGVLISINGGQHLTHAVGPVGLLLLYGGLAAVAAFTFVEYRRLARH